jgi:uncharacterized protein (TIGR00369 family)
MLKDDDWCFACGQRNPHGLQLKNFTRDGGSCTVEFTAQRHHQGWMEMVHGGIVATLLDEIMTRNLWEQGHNVATAELTVRYHQAAPVGKPLLARSWVVASRRRYFATAAELLLSDGSLVASAQAKFLIPRDEYEGDD